MRNALMTLAFGVACLVFAGRLGGYHIVWRPTPDQLYGCTVAQQAPNGDCP